MPKKPKYLHNRGIKKIFHLFFNGKVAEPGYFRWFNEPGNNFSVKLHKLANDKSEAPWQLIDRAIKKKCIMQKKDSFNFEDEDEFWCVFDIDDCLKENRNKFNAAIKNAEKNNINLCWSNECFEIWFLLHFEYCENILSRRDYDKKLQQYFKKELNFEYKKNSDVFEIFSDLQETAIKNAERLYKSNPNFFDNPSTKVFEIVKKLKLLERKNY